MDLLENLQKQDCLIEIGNFMIKFHHLLHDSVYGYNEAD